MRLEGRIVDCAVPIAVGIERAIIRSKADYYRLLRAVTEEGRWEEWILYMLRAVEETAGWTTAKGHAIRKLMQDTADRVRRKAPGVYSRELIELIFVRPYCRIGNLVEAYIAQRQTASVYLKELCGVGVLKEVKVGREKLFINAHLMTLLTSERDKRARATKAKETTGSRAAATARR